MTNCFLTKLVVSYTSDTHNTKAVTDLCIIIKQESVERFMLLNAEYMP